MRKAADDRKLHGAVLVLPEHPGAVNLWLRGSFEGTDRFVSIQTIEGPRGTDKT